MKAGSDVPEGQPADGAAPPRASVAHAAIAEAARPSFRIPIERLLTWEFVAVFGVVALAFVARLAWLAVADAQPTDIQSGDPFFYHTFAQMIADGRGFVHITGVPTAQWPPGYPLALAALYKAFGAHVILAKLLSVSLGAATCLLVYLTGKKVFSRNVGLAAAAILAVFPSQVFSPTLVMTEVPATFLIALFTWLVVTFAIDSPSWKKAVAVGAVIGAMSLVRGETLLLAAPLAVVWAVAEKSLWTGLRYGTVALVATFAVITPWVIRNAITMDYPIMISTGSAENLIAGHWPEADGKGSFKPILEVDYKYEGVPFPKNEVLVYKEATRRAISFALHNPGKELELIPKKLWEFYRADDRPLIWIQRGTLDEPAFSEQEENNLRALSNVYYGIVIGAAVLAAPLWLSRRDPRKLLLLLVVLYYSFIFGFVFIGEQRFHSALIPLFSLFAAALLVGLTKGIRGRSSILGLTRRRRTPPARRASHVRGR